MSILKFLKDLGKELENNFTCLNYGGCCVVAGYVALHLRHYCPDLKIRVNGDWGTPNDYNSFKQSLNNTLDPDEWRDNGAVFPHVLIQFKYKNRNYLIDSEGVYKTKEWPGLVKGWLSVNEAIALGSTPRGWNTDFDRDQIPAIRRTITKMFKEYKDDFTSSTSDLRCTAS